MRNSQNIRPYRQISSRPRSLSPMVGLSSNTQLSDSISSELINQAYILPKFTNIQLNYPAKLENKPSEELKTSLFNKLASLEKLHKCDLLKIEQLERQVQELTGQLESMKKANKSLLEEKGFAGGELHALYQNLFITDMKQQMTDMNSDIVRFRFEKEQMKKELEYFRKENGQLKASIKRYRVMLVKGLKRNTKESEGPDDGSSAYSVGVSEIDRSFTRTDSEKKKVSHELHHHSHSVKINSISLSRIEKLNLVLIQLINCTNINQLCKVITRAAISLTKSTKVSIYIVESKARDQYTKSYSGSADFIGRVRIGNTWILMHTHKEAYQEEPLFKKFEDLKYPIRQADHLIIPIIHNREICLIIQCQEKKGHELKHQIYIPLDELLLKIVANSVALKIESIYSNEQEKVELKNSSQIAQVASRIISSLTHRDIANRVRSVLPHFFDFENAGIVFIDHKTNQFYVMIHDPSSDDYFGDGYLRFPFGIGLTGQAISRDGISVFPNPKTIAIYNPEIDNVGWVHETKCIVMGCLKDWNGNLIGVVQLTNKKDDEVGPKDVKRLESFLELLGTCIATANLAVEQFSITIKFKSVMETLTKLALDSDKSASESEFATIVTQITNLKTGFNDWAKNRKPRF